MPLTKIKNFPNRAFAELASNRLDSQGILSWIRSPDIGILGPSGWAVPQGADLYVEEENAAEARRLISVLFGDI
jgi:hypothetical protein